MFHIALSESYFAPKMLSTLKVLNQISPNVHIKYNLRLLYAKQYTIRLAKFQVLILNDFRYRVD